MSQATQTQSKTYTVGDRVVINPLHDPRGRFAGVVYRVEKIKPVNLLLAPEDPRGVGLRRLNSRPEYLLPADDAHDTNVRATRPHAGVPETPPAHLWGGEVVTVRTRPTGKWTYAPGQLFVVLRCSGGTVSVARLGGENGRYWRVPRTDVIVVDPARLRLVAEA